MLVYDPPCCSLYTHVHCFPFPPPASCKRSQISCVGKALGIALAFPGPTTSRIRASHGREQATCRELLRLRCQNTRRESMTVTTSVAFLLAWLIPLPNGLGRRRGVVGVGSGADAGGVRARTCSSESKRTAKDTQTIWQFRFMDYRYLKICSRVLLLLHVLQ